MVRRRMSSWSHGEKAAGSKAAAGTIVVTNEGRFNRGRRIELEPCLTDQ